MCGWAERCSWLVGWFWWMDGWMDGWMLSVCVLSIASCVLGKRPVGGGEDDDRACPLQWQASMAAGKSL